MAFFTAALGQARASAGKLFDSKRRARFLNSVRKQYGQLAKKARASRAQAAPDDSPDSGGGSAGSALRSPGSGASAAQRAAKRQLGFQYERVRQNLLRFNTTLRSIPALLAQLAGVVGWAGVGSLGFLAIFLIHQLLLWASVNPAQAFENAKSVYVLIEIVWNTIARLLNATSDVGNVLIPSWNMVSTHFVEPGVYIVLDVFCLIFFQKPYSGIISEEQVPYRGFYCDAGDPQSGQFCGDFNTYYQRLGQAEETGSGVVNGSLVFTQAVGRRLSDAVTEPIVPILDMGSIMGALNTIVTLFIVVGAQLLDVALHVAYAVLSELAVIILDAIYTLLNTLVDVVLMLVRSGLLEKILGLVLDILVIFFVELYIPYLFFQMDAFLCILNLFFGQNTWDAQLECAACSTKRSQSTPTTPT
jgi:hypothetical protein